jgi:hypothetical protein
MFIWSLELKFENVFSHGIVGHFCLILVSLLG